MIGYVNDRVCLWGVSIIVSVERERGRGFNRISGK